MEPSKNKLIFVYNAQSDPLSAAFDFVHKIVSPNTYECSLCKLSYSNFGMKKDWKEFIQSLKMDVEFKYKDSFQTSAELPAIFVKSKSKPNNSAETLLVTSQELNGCKDLSSLIDLVKTKLNNQL